jgi:5'-AMP-activated protein kinase catalytic alpha subunit
MVYLRKRKVDSYDGQLIKVNGEPAYELGNYLGGGVAGVVYEAASLKAAGHELPHRAVAMKILNPVGFKLMPSGPLQVKKRAHFSEKPSFSLVPCGRHITSLSSSFLRLCQRCLVVRKGLPLEPGQRMGVEHVWWCVQPGGNRNVVAAQIDPRSGQLRELPLPRCIEVWGWDPLREGNKTWSSSSDEDDDDGSTSVSSNDFAKGGCGGNSGSRQRLSRRFLANGSSANLSDEAVEKLLKASGEVVTVEGLGVGGGGSDGAPPTTVHLPKVPPKFVKWLRARQRLGREIANMANLGAHPNVVQLLEVLEYVQDSKSTLFLVLELVTGGELFDRIQAMGPNNKAQLEEQAQRYFHQLVRGVGFCHAKGVAHRDLVSSNTTN